MSSGAPDYSGKKVDVILRAEWEVVGGKDKVFTGAAGSKAFGEYIRVSYTVPVGKTLYINTATAVIVASAAADGDLEQHCYLEVTAPDTATFHLRAGGNGGVVIPLTQPIKVTAGGLLTIDLVSYANHNVGLALSVRGYEI